MDTDRSFDFDLDGGLWDIDHDDPLDQDIDGIDLPPPPDPPREPFRGQPAPDEGWAVSLILFGSLMVLGLLKLMFWMVGSAWAVALTAAAFVFAHGLFIGIGATWFWPRRYRREW